MCLQLGPNADLRKWEDEQLGIAIVRFGAKDAKEKNKVRTQYGVHDFIRFSLTQTNTAKTI